MIIEVVEVKIRKGTGSKGDWVNTSLKATDKKWYSTFCEGAEHITKGNRIDIDPTQNEQGYWNFESFTIVDKVDAKEPVPVEKIRVDRGDSKNRAFSLSYAKDYHCARIRAGVVKDIPETEIIATAILFESYLDKGG